MDGTTIIFSVGQETYEAGYTDENPETVAERLMNNEYIRCDSPIGEVWVNHDGVQYFQPGKAHHQAHDSFCIIKR